MRCEGLDRDSGSVDANLSSLHAHRMGELLQVEAESERIVEAVGRPFPLQRPRISNSVLPN
jgi:hypothetical protein